MKILVTANRKYNIKGPDGKLYFNPEDGEFEIEEDNEAVKEGGVTPVDKVAFLEKQVEFQKAELARAMEAKLISEKEAEEAAAALEASNSENQDDGTGAQEETEPVQEVDETIEAFTIRMQKWKKAQKAAKKS